MARGGNLRLSNAVISGLANPNFTRAAGVSIGAGILGAERREREEEDRSTEEATLELLRKAQVAQETGDMRLLNEVRTDFDGMLTGAKSSKSRTLITEGINTVSTQRAATQKAAQTNTAMSIIKTQQAIDDMNNSTAPMTNEEYMERAKVQGALEERLAKMKQNSAAVLEAETIQFKADEQALTREATLRTKRIEAATNVLASLDFDSEEYQEAVKRFEGLGLGKAVRQDIEDRQKLTKLQGEIRAQQLVTGRLSDEEMADAKKLELSIMDRNDPLSRKLYNAAKVKQIELEAQRSLQPISTPEQNRAEGLVKAQLRAIARQGDFVDFVFNRDIATRIEDLSDEQVEDVLGRVAGLAEKDIPNEVNAWLIENFPKEMQRSATFASKNKADAEDIAELSQEILKDNLSAKGININEATEEQLEQERRVAQQQARLALDGAERALRRQSAPKGTRRDRRGPIKIPEPDPFTIQQRPGVGGQMSRQKR